MFVVVGYVFVVFFRVTTAAQPSISRPETGTGKAVTRCPWFTPPCCWTYARKAPRNWPSTHHTQITPGPTTTSSSSPSPAESQVRKSLIIHQHGGQGTLTRCYRYHQHQHASHRGCGFSGSPAVSCSTKNSAFVFLQFLLQVWTLGVFFCLVCIDLDTDKMRTIQHSWFGNKSFYIQILQQESNWVLKPVLWIKLKWIADLHIHEIT